MGRFKIYDPKTLVNILSDTNYAKCLICEKVLKNVMGNIKRHYEQIHDTVLDANITHKKKSKRKSPNNTDEKYKSLKIQKKSKDSVPTTSTLNNVDDGYDWINEYQLNCNSRPALTIVSTPSGNKIYQQLETRKFNTTHPENVNIKMEMSPTTSNIRSECETYLSTKQDVIQQLPITNLTLCPQVNNIQISSLNLHHDDTSLKCLVGTKTALDITLNHFSGGSTFQTALQSWSQDISININTNTIAKHLDDMVKKLHYEIKNIVGNRFIYLKLDIASIKENNVMLVNIQFIKDFEIKVFTLSVLELLDDHISTDLKGRVLTILERYKIDIGKVYSITKDYTNNVMEPFKMPEEYIKTYLKEEEGDNNVLTYEYCQHMSEKFPGHVLHFVACEIIQKLNENISQSRDSARNLRKHMTQLNIEPIPILDKKTSWISVYDMVKSLLDIRAKVENKNELSVEVDWVFVTKFQASFKPIVDTVSLLQSNHFIMGDLYREWLVCETELEELSTSNELALYLLEVLRKRKLHLFENPSFLAALYLDPRFCYMGSMHLNDKQKKVAIAHLLQIFKKLKSAEENEKKSALNTKKGQKKLNERYLKLEKKIAANMGICNKMKMVLPSSLTSGGISLEEVDSSQSIEEALEQLQFDERLPFHANILDYWKTITYKNQVLARIAEIALGAPATQTTVTRAFNALPVMLTKHKINISPDNLNNIIILQLNQDLVNKLSLE